MRLRAGDGANLSSTPIAPANPDRTTVEYVRVTDLLTYRRAGDGVISA
jgi:hypothetical protein